MTILEVCGATTWCSKEMEWISLCRSMGISLLNILPGGQGPPPLGQQRTVSQSTRDKLRQASKIQWSNPESRARLSQRKKERFASLSEEKKEHLRQVGRIELAKHHQNSESQRRAARCFWERMAPEEKMELLARRKRLSQERVISPEEHARRAAANKKAASTPASREMRRQIKLKDWARITPEQREERSRKMREGIMVAQLARGVAQLCQ